MTDKKKIKYKCKGFNDQLQIRCTKEEKKALKKKIKKEKVKSMSDYGRKKIFEES
jgi:hypothetical protein